MSFSSLLSLKMTYSGLSSPRRMRSDFPSRNLPFWSIIPVRSISEIASIMPEPQMPRGLPPPMTRIDGSRVTGSIITDSIAPGVALMPHLMPLPSKQGPAEQAAVMIHSLLPIAISPLVPMSMNSASSSLRVIFDASTPATMSPPT